MQLVFLVREITPYWQQFLQDFSAAWKNLGTLTVISSGEKSDELHPWEGTVAEGLEVVVIPPLFEWKWGGTIWPSTALWRCLDELKPVVVVIQEYSPYVVIGGLLWAKANRRPCIVTTDVGPAQRKQLSVVQRITHRVVNSLIDGVLARTQDAYDQATVGQKPRLLAPHAIDTRFYGATRPIRAKPKRIIQVGSLIPRKGIDLLLEAMVLVRQYRPEAELVLVGAGDHVGTRKLASSLGIEANVSVMNFLQTPELIEEYLNSDVFVLASRFDSYGVVTHEAAAAGLPLVVSRHAGSSATLVEPGENGFQVDPEDRAGMAEAILNCLDPVHNTLMSQKSREIARKHDSKFLAAKTANWLAQFDRGEEIHQVPVSNGPLATLAGGLGRIGVEFLRKPTTKMAAWLAPDAFESARREIAFLNRYIPFYREAIFRRVAEWKSTILLYSGHTLGNLRSVQSVESEALGILKHPRTGNILWLRATSKLWKVRPKVVCTELSLSLLSTWWWLILRRILGFGLVFWTHGFQEYGWKDRQLGWKDRLRLWWMHQADAVIFYGKSRMMDVIEIGGEKPHFFLAPNTLDTTAYAREFAALSEEGREAVRRRLGLTNRAMVYVGRLDPEKEVLGLVDLLRATRDCQQPPILIVIGGGVMEDSLRSAIAQEADRVRMVGPIFDLVEKAAWIFASDVMVCPGYAGLNVVDALALGCPFATVAEGKLQRRHSPEITYVEHGINGLIASDLTRLGADLREWFDSGSPIQLSSQEISRKFMHESRIERQFEGMQRAFQFAMSKNTFLS